MKERKKPTQSWIEKSKNEIEREEELLAKRMELLNDVRIKKLLYQDSEAFKIGYEAGKQEMIEKACEWLKKWTYQDCLGVSPIARLKVGFSSVEELVDEFIKAVEE